MSYVRECRRERKFQLAQNRLASLKHSTSNLPGHLGLQTMRYESCRVRMEEAKVFWASDEQTIAKFQLVDLLAKLKSDQVDRDQTNRETML